MMKRLLNNRFIMSWDTGWKQNYSGSSNADVAKLIAEVDDLIEKADSKALVVEIINKLKIIISCEPDNYYALWTLGRYCQLIVVGYSDDENEKEKYCILGIRACERAMYTNKAFKAQIDAGKQLWEAVDVLTRNEIEAMYYWYSTVGAYWKECRGFFGQILNLKWPFRAKKILKRMMDIDPEWGGGHPYFAFAVYYSLTPGFGNKKKAAEYFQKAVETGPKWLYIRWGRAKYLYNTKKDQELFRKDLEYIISCDPEKADSPFPWNVYFQKSAQEMLDNICINVK